MVMLVKFFTICSFLFYVLEYIGFPNCEFRYLLKKSTPLEIGWMSNYNISSKTFF